MEFLGKHPGSFGEILQGTFKRQEILVSCPINLYSYARVYESKDKNIKIHNMKCYRFMDYLLRRWNFENYIKDINIEIKTSIPIGKGFASSTADIGATYRALTKMFNKKYNELELLNLALKIEPTDSIIFDKFTMIDYKSGKYIEKIGDYIEFYILVFEGNKFIDTIDFNKNIKMKMQDIDDLIPILKKGILNKDVETIARVSTDSITRNLSRLNYDYLDFVLKYKEKSNGLGVIGAHSGDALGIIYDSEEKIRNAFKNLDMQTGLKVYTVKTILNNSINFNY